MRATFTSQIGSKKGERKSFDGSLISIGRAANNALSFGENERRVSSHHAQVTRRGDQYVLVDLGSTNGTMVNGRRVMATEIHHDDLIEFGAGGPLVRFAIEGDSDDQPTEAIAQSADRQADTLGGIAANSENSRRSSTHRNNVALILALVGAMAIGAIAGIVASPSIRVRDEELSLAELAEQNSPAVVLVRVEFETLDRNGQTITREARIGSGFVITTDGLIVTNRHVVRAWEYDSSIVSGRTTKVEVILSGRTRDEALTAEIARVAADKYPDVALLRINSPGLRTIRGVADNIEEINRGDDVAAIGYPLGLDLLALTSDTRIEPSLTTGIVSRVGHDAIQLSLRANHGNSGGPAINRRGEVIGIVTSNVGAAPDITLCTPISAALELTKH